MYSEFVRFLQSGGAFMYPIMIVFAFGLALLKRIMPLLANGRFDEVNKITTDSRVAICMMLSLGISRKQASAGRDDVEMAMEEVMMETIPRLEKRTHYIAMFANIATLLGLLGTITFNQGIYRSCTGRSVIKGGDFVQQYICRHEYNGFWVGGCDPAHNHIFNPAIQDN